MWENVSADLNMRVNWPQKCVVWCFRLHIWCQKQWFFGWQKWELPNLDDKMLHHPLQNDSTGCNSLGSLQMFHFKFSITLCFYRFLIFFLFFYQENHVIPRLVILLKTAYIMWFEREQETNSVAPDAETIFWEFYQWQGILFAKINLRKPSPQKTYTVPLQKRSHHRNEQMRLLQQALKKRWWLNMIYYSTLFCSFGWFFNFICVFYVISLTYFWVNQDNP